VLLSIDVSESSRCSFPSKQLSQTRCVCAVECAGLEEGVEELRRGDAPTERCSVCSRGRRVLTYSDL